MTLDEARTQLLADLDKGTTCPCCERYAKKYKRKLNSGMAYFLLLIYRRSGDDYPWLHIVDVFSGADRRASAGGEYAKLRYWGLIESHPNTDPDKSASGLWRITEKGKQFVRGEITVQSHIYSLNNEVLGFSDSDITITKALGTQFNYSDLMAA